MKNFSIEAKNLESSNAALIRTTGSINSNSSPALDDQFDDLISQGKHTIVVDLANTEFINSSGLGVLLGRVASLREEGGDLIMMNVPRLIADIFDILGIKSHFRIIASVDELKVATE